MQLRPFTGSLLALLIALAVVLHTLADPIHPADGTAPSNRQHGEIILSNRELPQAQGNGQVTYLPLIFGVPPMVSLDSAWTGDANGVLKLAYLPNEAIRYIANGVNPNSVNVPINFRWSQEGPCGSSVIANDNISIAPGTWSHSNSATAPSCVGVYTNTVQITNGVQVATLQTNFVVNPASTVILENRQGFDRCYLPSVTEMQTWWDHSPYWTFNIYLGGSMFFCQNDIPDAFWVHQVARQGWSFILTWVGPQAPCSSFREKMDANPTTAYQQGRSEASSAAQAASRLGFLGNRVIYYDMEGYSSTAPLECRQTVAAFIRGWTQRLHELGYWAGGYGSPLKSYIADWASNQPPPDEIWIAHWIRSSYDPNVTVWSPYLSNDLWNNHQRLRQYAGGHVETWGGVSLAIDSNVLDGAVTKLPFAPNFSTGIATSDALAGKGGLIRSAHKLSTTQGWLLRDNQLLITQDNGQSWSEITPPLTGPQTPILGAYFWDSLHAWLTRPSETDTAQLTIQRTQDGGKTWEEFPIPTEVLLLEDEFPSIYLEFTDPSIGWLVIKQPGSSSFSSGRMFATQDGGETWEEREIPLGEPVVFTDADHGWTAGGPAGNQLYRTTDGGHSWQLQYVPIPEIYNRVFFSLPQFVDSANGILPVTVSTSSDGAQLIFETVDGGNHWTLQELIPLEASHAMRQALPFSLSQDMAWQIADPSAKRLYITDSRGASPKAYSLPAGVIALDYASAQSGWALVQQGDCQGEKSASKSAGWACSLTEHLLATSDGGRTWREITP